MEKNKKVGFLATLLKSKHYCDLKLICNGEAFEVHKAIVCSQSTFFANACDKAKGFKVSIWRIAESHVNED
jgi:hypothetical protein